MDRFRKKVFGTFPYFLMIILWPEVRDGEVQDTGLYDTRPHQQRASCPLFLWWASWLLPAGKFDNFVKMEMDSRWLLCRQIIVLVPWCFSLSVWKVGTAQRWLAGSYIREISGSSKQNTPHSTRLVFRFDHTSGNFVTHELSSLHDGQGKPLPLDELYLDTTFCSPQYKTFPTREEAQEEIWRLCKKWVTKGSSAWENVPLNLTANQIKFLSEIPFFTVLGIYLFFFIDQPPLSAANSIINRHFGIMQNFVKNGMYKDTRSKHVVLFVLPAKYGYEGILNNIYQKSRNCWRVHVNPSKFSEYLCSSELSSCTSDIPQQAQWLHACQTGKRMGNQPMLKSLPCQSGDFEVCQIRPSAMFFTQKKMAEQVAKILINSYITARISQVAAGHDRVVSVSQGGSNYRVCYSTHSR